MPTDDVGWYTTEIAEQLRLSIVFATPLSNKSVNENRVDFRPWWVYRPQSDRRGQPGARSLDVVPISVRPPNEHGYCRLGPFVWDAKDAVMRARTVVAVLNEQLPRTYGDTWIHVSDIDWFVNDPNLCLRVGMYRPRGRGRGQLPRTSRHSFATVTLCRSERARLPRISSASVRLTKRTTSAGSLK